MDPKGGGFNTDIFSNNVTSTPRENLTAREALERHQANPNKTASKKCPHNASLPCSLCDPVAANAQLIKEGKTYKPEHSCDYFDLFSCPHKFNMDDAQLKALTNRYRDYQRVLHPDVYSAKTDTTDADLKDVQQQSAAIAAAYRTLRNPYQRAIYLLSLNGIDIERLSETQYRNMAGGSSVAKPNLDDLRAQEQAMLLHVMEVRETLEESEELEEIKDILTASSSQITECLHAMEIAFERRDLFEARHRTVLLNYLSKIQQEAENKLESLQR
jgi:molecular chaperone HscB